MLCMTTRGMVRSKENSAIRARGTLREMTDAEWASMIRDMEKHAHTNVDIFKAVITPRRWRRLMHAVRQRARRHRETATYQQRATVCLMCCTLVDLPHECLAELLAVVMQAGSAMSVYLHCLTATHTDANDVGGGPATALTQLKCLFESFRQRDGALIACLLVHTEVVDLYALLRVARPLFSPWVFIGSVSLDAPNCSPGAARALAGILSDCMHYRGVRRVTVVATRRGPLDAACATDADEMERLARQSVDVATRIAVWSADADRRRVVSPVREYGRAERRARGGGADRVWSAKRHEPCKLATCRMCYPADVPVVKTREVRGVDSGRPYEDMEATCARITKTYPLAEYIIIGSPRMRWQQSWSVDMIAPRPEW